MSDKTELKLFWAPRTRASRIVWLLEELERPYQRISVDTASNPTKCADPEFEVSSPMLKVPAIADGDTRLAESGAIALYLADRYGSETFSPPIDDPLRGQYLYWMFFTPAVIEPSMIERVTQMKPNPGQYGWGSFDLMVSTLRRGLKDRQWILGDEFSAADVMVGASAAFLKMFDMLPFDPVIDDYVERCLNRPAYKKALALDQG